MENLCVYFVSIDKQYVMSVHYLVMIFLSSSGVERSAVNRFVVGSNPTWGVLFGKIYNKLSNAVSYRRTVGNPVYKINNSSIRMNVAKTL